MKLLAQDIVDRNLLLSLMRKVYRLYGGFGGDEFREYARDVLKQGDRKKQSSASKRLQRKLRMLNLNVPYET